MVKTIKQLAPRAAVMAVLLMVSRATRTSRTETVANRHCKRYQSLFCVNFLSKMCIDGSSSWHCSGRRTSLSILIVEQVADISEH